MSESSDEESEPSSLVKKFKFDYPEGYKKQRWIDLAILLSPLLFSVLNLAFGEPLLGQDMPIIGSFLTLIYIGICHLIVRKRQKRRHEQLSEHLKKRTEDFMAWLKLDMMERTNRQVVEGSEYDGEMRRLIESLPIPPPTDIRDVRNN